MVRFLIALGTGAVMALSMPPMKTGFLAWFALIPFFIALESARGYREAWLLGFIHGFAYFGGTVYWIAWNTGTIIPFRIASMLGTVLLTAGSFSFFILLYRLLIVRFGRNAHFLAPLIWAGWEALWHTGDLAFPWPLVALTQAQYLPVSQLAAVGGTTMITLWVVAINGILAAGRNRRGTGFVALLMVVSVWIGGAMRVGLADGFAQQLPPIGRVGLVQGNIEAAKKWELGPQYSLDAYIPVTREAEKENPDLIVWPETAAPVYVQQSNRWRRYFQAFVDSLGIPIVTGGRYTEFTPDERIPYNPAFLVTPGAHGLMKRYLKVFLVPLGERVPFQSIFPQLGNLNFGQAEFKPGSEAVVWDIRTHSGDTIKVAPNICFESIFPQHLVKSVREEAQIQLNLTNDGWYVHTSGPIQHLQLSKLSAIETGRAVVRATNTGISAIIAPSGRFLKLLPEFVRGSLVSDIPQPLDTPFNHWGWAIRPLTLYLDFALLLLALFWRGKPSEEES